MMNLLPRVPNRGALFTILTRAPGSSSARSSGKRLKLATTTPRRPSGLNALPPSWRWRNPIGRLFEPNSPPPTPGLRVSSPFPVVLLLPILLPPCAYFLLTFSSGIASPSPPRCSRYNNGYGECERRHCRCSPGSAMSLPMTKFRSRFNVMA